MIILDTNVISEVLRSTPSDQVAAGLESLTGEVAITAVTFAELLAGLGGVPDSRQKAELSARIAAAIEPFREPWQE